MAPRLASWPYLVTLRQRRPWIGAVKTLDASQQASKPVEKLLEKALKKRANRPIFGVDLFGHGDRALDALIQILSDRAVFDADVDLEVVNPGAVVEVVRADRAPAVDDCDLGVQHCPTPLVQAHTALEQPLV